MSRQEHSVACREQMQVGKNLNSVGDLIGPAFQTDHFSPVMNHTNEAPGCRETLTGRNFGTRYILRYAELYARLLICDKKSDGPGLSPSPRPKRSRAGRSWPGFLKIPPYHQMPGCVSYLITPPATP